MVKEKFEGKVEVAKISKKYPKTNYMIQIFAIAGC